MRKIFFFLFFFSFALFAKAQFGYYSNSNVMKALPTYEQAAADYERLCNRCEKEIEHNERELTRKYVAFLDGYRDFPEPILRKRQNELQRLVDNSINITVFTIETLVERPVKFPSVHACCFNISNPEIRMNGRCHFYRHISVVFGHHLHFQSIGQFNAAD